MRLIAALALASAILLPHSVLAQVFGEAARTEFFGGLGVRAFYSRVNKTRLLLAGEEIQDPQNMDVFVNLAPVALVFGARPGLSLIAILPTISRTFERTLGGQRVSEHDFGIGDMSLLVKYRFYKKDGFLQSRQLALQVGLKLPTGADDLTSSDGNRLPQPLQLGSGSVDPSAVLVFTQARNRLIVSGDVGYLLTTEANNFENGNVFKYDAAVKFRFHPIRFSDENANKQHFIFLELNGVVRQRSSAAGREIANSGGHELFLAPGAQIFLWENFLLEAGVQIPILQNLSGAQLGTDFSLRTGLRWILSP